jgi:hypothetical protein
LLNPLALFGAKQASKNYCVESGHESKLPKNPSFVSGQESKASEELMSCIRARL